MLKNPRSIPLCHLEGCSYSNFAILTKQFFVFLVFFVFVFLNLLKDQEWPDYYIYLSAQISVATKTASWIYLPPTKASWVESDFLKDPVTQIRNLAIIL